MAGAGQKGVQLGAEPKYGKGRLAAILKKKTDKTLVKMAFIFGATIGTDPNQLCKRYSKPRGCGKDNTFDSPLLFSAALKMALRTLLRHRLQPSCLTMIRPLSQGAGSGASHGPWPSSAHGIWVIGLPFSLGKLNHVAIAVPDMGMRCFGEPC